MKKIISIILAVVTLFTCSICAFAADSNNSQHSECYRIVPEGVKKPTKEDVEAQYALSGFSPDSIDFITGDFEMVTAASVRKVAVTEPCDQTWRSKYPDSWMWEAHRTVTAADDMLTSRFGIQFYSVSQKYWDNDISSYDPDAMVRNAHAEWGLRDGAKLMIAFTNKYLYDAWGGKIFGLVEDIGRPYLLVSCYGYNENRVTVRHEVGHCYGLIHCKYGTNCVLAEAAPASTYNQLCSDHNSKWNAAKTKY